jgi:hypothetical protein
MVKSIIIENPQLELEILQQIAALDGVAGIKLTDYLANPEALSNLAFKLQGLPAYMNDICPWHKENCLYYDMDSALQYLEGIKKEIGNAAFANSKIVFEEILLGLDFKKMPQFADWNLAPNEPPHHVIVRAYNISKTGSFKANPPINALPVSRQTQELVYNLQLFNDGQPVLVAWTIEQPDRELRLLREIAGSDGDNSSISAADIRNNRQKVASLEAYRLYTNDPGEDATQADLNSAYTLLRDIGGKFDLTHIDVMLSEKILPDNGRRVIQEAQVVSEYGTPGFTDWSNFGL